MRRNPYSTNTQRLTQSHEILMFMHLTKLHHDNEYNLTLCHCSVVGCPLEKKQTSKCSPVWLQSTSSPNSIHSMFQSNISPIYTTSSLSLFIFASYNVNCAANSIACHYMKRQENANFSRLSFGLAIQLTGICDAV